ncbi:hypothetical protein [Ancylobacter rudongensis]|uniref:Uncharacterized protein n=1 Tax=Ancylobacter rudongensis TaxID=177413 RepID=A0A1G4UML5_9HYPH|nr:hypothetical protein [Ancylobacter rudongensis]SCW94903.1 hypothetical protein SAMN05660859_4189 [Ancylobacter rudongensis]
MSGRPGGQEKEHTEQAPGGDEAGDTVRRPPILLLTPVDLDTNGIGALFLRELLSSSPLDIVVQREPQYLMENGVMGGRFGSLARATSNRVPFFHALRLRLFGIFSLDRRVAAVSAAADALGAKTIWITASSPEVILVAERLAAMGRDLRVMVWDDPSYSAYNLGLDPSFQHELMERFGVLLKKARRISVIGRNMQEMYAAKYGVCSNIIRHGIDIKNIYSRKSSVNKNEINIVFAGSLYSKMEWNCFISALESVGFKLDNIKIKVSFIGDFPVTGARRSTGVNFLGRKSFQEAMSILSEMDIGYLPYWFDSSHETVARTSFPSKLSAYAIAGLAVFHHAPAYTEVTTLMQRLPFGVACPSLEGSDIIDCVRELIDMLFTDKCIQARQDLLDKEIDKDVMNYRFSFFLS